MATQVVEPEEAMGALEFIASMTESLAWPLAALLIAFLFRAQIRFLISRLNEIGIGDAKAKFARELDEAEKKAELLSPLPEPGLLSDDVAVGSSIGEPQAAKDGDRTEVNEEKSWEAELARRRAVTERYSEYGIESYRFAALLDVSPSAAILDTYRVVERALYRIVERRGLKVATDRTTVRQLAGRLSAAGIIPVDVATLIYQ